MKVFLVEQIHHNEKWEEFLSSLPDQATRDIAGHVMTWIKETYPQFVQTLNGELIAEITKES